MKIVIDGNIGCGKTTVIKSLNDKLRIPIFLEPLQKWSDYLKLFYENPQKWAFPFNLEVLTTFAEWKHNLFPAIYERCPLSCRYIFTELNYDLGHLHKLEMATFDKIYKDLKWEPEVLIYIRTDPSICSQRMKERGRSCESEVPKEYIQSVHDKYEAMINNESIMKYIKFHIIDGNQEKEKVFNDICEILKTYVS